MNEVSRVDMLALLERQRRAWLDEGVVSLATRRDRIERAMGVVRDNAERFVEAMRADFGHRSVHQSMFTDIMASMAPLKHAHKQVARWMKPEKRSPEFPMGLLGASARVEFQPLGVVGVISPWNFPVQLTFAPLGGILAAGNRVMIKPSEYTPATSDAMAEAFRAAFDDTEIAVVCGGPETGAGFSGLPFDHLLFTGATSIGRHVMRAAADNLVPVTLELGGKSPVVVGRSASIARTTEAIMAGKMMNAGQICLAPDYVFVPEDSMDEFVAATHSAVAKMFPTLLDNDDYTSIINERHHQRLTGYVEQARAAGAEVVEINPAGEDFGQQPHHKMPPTLIIDPDDSLDVMQDEIFGPVMPLKRYRNIDETIEYINGRPRPLGLYYFGSDGAEEQRVLSHTTSGGVTVNDVIMHVAQEDLPFGGVGPSGMGAYHGRDGFRTFSHARSVFRAPRVDLAALAGLRPPYTDRLLKLVNARLG